MWEGAALNFGSVFMAAPGKKASGPVLFEGKLLLDLKEILLQIWEESCAGFEGSPAQHLRRFLCWI